MVSCLGVFTRVLVRRTIATERHAVLLACAKVNPDSPDLDAFFAFVPMWMFYRPDRFDVAARIVWHLQTMFV